MNNNESEHLNQQPPNPSLGNPQPAAGTPPPETPPTVIQPTPPPPFQPPEFIFASPPQLPRKPFWGPWATIGFTFAIIAVFFIIQNFIAFVFVVLNINSTGLDVTGLTKLASNGLLLSLATYFSAAAGVVLIIVFIKARKTISVTEYLGLKKIKPGTIFAAAGITLVLLFVLQLLTSLFPSSNTGDQFGTNAYSTVWRPLLWIAVVVFAPVFEEFLFRGFMFVGLKDSGLGTAGTVFFTALLWAGLHSLEYDPLTIGIIFVFGIFLGILRLRTKSLWATITAHAFWNFLEMVVTALAVAGVIH